LSAPRGASALRVLFQKFGRVTDGQNGLRGIVGNFTAEFFFESHYELDGIETVGRQSHSSLNLVLFHWTDPRRTSHRGREFHSQSRIVLRPVTADTDPAHDDRLRTANIQGFNVLQWCSLPLIAGSVIILPKP
jgi:hypothetical protein